MACKTFRHRILDKYFLILGAHTTSTGNRVFSAKENGFPERMFLADPDLWDAPRVEIEALWIQLAAREEARMKAKRARERAEERKRIRRRREAEAPVEEVVPSTRWEFEPLVALEIDEDTPLIEDLSADSEEPQSDDGPVEELCEAVEETE
jgi:hypothetical protein